VHCLPMGDMATLPGVAEEDGPQIAVISALPPFGVGQSRSLCKLLRQRYPQLKIILGLWAFRGGIAKARERVRTDCVDLVATSFQQAIVFLVETRQSIGPTYQEAMHPQIS
jgi:hypothetical protein